MLLPLLSCDELNSCFFNQCHVSFMQAKRASFFCFLRCKRSSASTRRRRDSEVRFCTTMCFCTVRAGLLKFQNLFDWYWKQSLHLELSWLISFLPSLFLLLRISNSSVCCWKDGEGREKLASFVTARGRGTVSFVGGGRGDGGAESGAGGVRWCWCVLWNTLAWV